jgi:pimeloyl-ACP methyl ester carboxylesterase
LLIELPLAPVIQAVPPKPAPVLAPPVTKDETETSDQRPTTREAYEPPRPYESLELYIHLPPDAAKHQPLRTLIVLHGIGSRGDIFSQNLVEEADRNSWLLIAPTVPYRDYMDPTNLLKEDVRFSALLTDMLDNLPKKLGMKLRRHALVYGFSRGAQLGHRFALFYPERVESIVAISAGTYTLPVERKSGDPTALMPMPYGVGDMVNYVGHPLDREELRKVSFFLQVGANDNDPDEVPRQFDPYSGKNRVARAYAFQYALLALNVQSRLTVYPDAGHQITTEMRKTALQFLRSEELAKKLND